MWVLNLLSEVIAVIDQISNGFVSLLKCFGTVPTSFWSEVGKAAIGSFLGFFLGILAFGLQQRSHLRAAAREERLALLDALNRLITSAGANVEALVQLKLQLLDDLKPEADRVKELAEAAFESDPSSRPAKVQELVELCSTMRYFYQSVQPIQIMRPPDFSEFSSGSRQMPALSLFVHRALGCMEECNRAGEARNLLISELAKESAARHGLPEGRVLYFSQMLAGEANALVENTDFSMDFWRLVLDQLVAFENTLKRDEGLLRFELLPEVENAMPSEELFPKLREQLKKFV
ncbi:hypothetical protein O4H48_18535 [Rhodobacteraceae bacterium G21628-S1]|nr:hypothetical protein [Rhodobacteraceae bacterium G21628-S1]